MKFSKFFSGLQEEPWYRQFLNPVLDEIKSNTQLLDIGTGSGKMLEILYNEKNVKSVGTDTSADMLKEAEMKLKNTNTELHLIKAGNTLPFDKNNFDYVTICSVLFHMKENEIDAMLSDSLNVLNENGQIIVLTPTGGGSILKLTQHYFSVKNKGAFIWYCSTKPRAKQWTAKMYLADYANKNNLKYQREIVMNGFAQLEIINK